MPVSAPAPLERMQRPVRRPHGRDRSRALAPLIALAAIASTLVTLLPGAADASRSRAQPGYDGYVAAESRWGHGSASGPVRRGKWGWQVRLPGGTWVDCVRNNCSETLRLEALDMFEAMGRDAIDGGPGYFHWERRF